MSKGNEQKIEFCIELQISAVIKLIVNKYAKSIEEATNILYKSETYKILIDKETGLWAESPYYVLQSLEQELCGISREYR
ncbi:hypothetical protein SAMN05443428_1563 [Caloramator quimbayensis]|uniref:Uncharacterized protein n=1 Tax=Caloramator quimbayensis TaxID=1147123 RepID=A0A1T4YHM7_9CLOT|nr:hypothetical protein [Caloramator quimbayensis]SKB01294.1 hypothetical protein SAMN05443428_1563 [Caloramator quimbayensis]